MNAIQEHRTQNNRYPLKLLAPVAAGLLALSSCNVGESESTISVAPPTTTEATTSSTNIITQSTISETAQATPEQHPEYLDMDELAAQYKTPKGAKYLGLTDKRNGNDVYKAQVGSSSFAKVFSISFAGGELVYEDATPEGLGQNEDFFHQVAENNRLFLQSAFEQGTLDEVVFYIGDPADKDIQHFLGVEGYPEYIDEDYTQSVEPMKIISYALPSNGTMPIDSVTTMLRHENIHALTSVINNKIGLDALSPEVASEYRLACEQIRTIAIDQAELLSADIQVELLKLRDLMPEQYRPSFDKIAMLLEASAFEQTQETEATAQAGGNGVMEECYVYDPWLAVMQEIRSQGIDTEGLFSLIIDNDEMSDLYVDIRDGWNDIIESLTIYNILREGTYFQDDSESPMGHPQDGWGEFVTSSANASLDYPEAFANMVAKLDPEQKQAVIAAVRISYDAIIDNNPLLRGYISGKEADLMAMINTK